jgi:hypothetical protein
MLLHYLLTAVSLLQRLQRAIWKHERGDYDRDDGFLAVAAEDLDSASHPPSNRNTKNNPFNPGWISEAGYAIKGRLKSSSNSKTTNK